MKGGGRAGLVRKGWSFAKRGNSTDLRLPGAGGCTRGPNHQQGPIPPSQKTGATPRGWEAQGSQAPCTSDTSSNGSPAQVPAGLNVSHVVLPSILTSFMSRTLFSSLFPWEEAQRGQVTASRPRSRLVAKPRVSSSAAPPPWNHESPCPPRRQYSRTDRHTPTF